MVDLRRVVRATTGGIRFLALLAERLDARGGRLALAPDTGADGYTIEGLPDSIAIFASLDLALEWCEDDLLMRLGEAPAVTETTLADHELLAGLSQTELDRLSAQLGYVTAAPGTFLVRQGEQASEVFLVTRGTLSVVREDESGRSHRLTTLSAGMTFGELAFRDRAARAADVRADSQVECRTLSYATIDALADSDPALHGKLLSNLLRVVMTTLHVVNAEVAHLTR